MAQPPRIVRLSPALYPSSAIERAREAFSHLCMVEQDSSGEDTKLTILPFEGSPPETADELLNYALCAAVVTHLSQ